METSLQRKSPRQRRSQKMLEDIFEGSKRGIIKFGLSNLSTTKISKMTGISVGSFYQYFKNKDTVLISMTDHFTDKTTRNLDNLMKATDHLSLEKQISQLLDEYTRVFWDNQMLFKDLSGMILTNILREKILSRRKSFINSLADLIERKTDFENIECLKKASFLVYSINGTLHMMAQDEGIPFTQKELNRKFLQLIRLELHN